ncbi:hypothetical protein ABKN59_010807 [Abortiporus biennis]
MDSNILSVDGNSEQDSVGADREIIRRKIGEYRINNLENHEALVKSTRHLNQLIPAALLPPEILADIFYICSLFYYEDHRDPIFEYRCKKWTSISHVSHVSHHWRNIALSSPHLWSNIIITFNTDCLKTCLLRSAEIPLSVYLEDEDSHDRKRSDLLCVFNILAEHLHRMQSLHVSTATPFLGTLSSLLHVSKAPILQSLTLRSEVQSEFQSMLLRQLFRCIATPSLTQLSILDSQYDWLKLEYPRTLVKLEIHYWDADTTPSYAEGADFLTHALGVLKNLPLLQYLDLSDVFPSYGTGFPDLEQTSFPALKEIRLDGWAPPIVHLYSHMTLSSSAILHFTLTYNSTEDWVQQHSKLSQCMFSHLKGAPNTDENSLRIILSSEAGFGCYVSLYAWKACPNVLRPKGTVAWGPPALQCSKAQHVPDIDISIDIFGDPEEELEEEPDAVLNVFLDQLASEIPLDKLETINISDIHSHLPVLKMISFSPKLSHICLDSDASLDEFLDIFEMGDKNMRFPALRSLEIGHYGPIEGIADGAPAAGRKRLERLCELLASWKDNGRRLKSVILRSRKTEFQALADIAKSLESLVDFFELLPRGD